MLLGCRASREGAEISPPPGEWIDLARVQPILARFQLADHALSRRNRLACIVVLGERRVRRPSVRVRVRRIPMRAHLSA
jgi:hypothetical protein